MKLVKFEILIEDITRAFEAGGGDGYSTDKERYTQWALSENSPLTLFYEKKCGNEFRKTILGKANVYTYVLEGYNLKDQKTKIKATKAFVAECRKDRMVAMAFIFWSLFILAVDKVDCDETLSFIADFAQLANIKNETLFNISQTIKVIFGDEEAKNRIVDDKEFDDRFRLVLDLQNFINEIQLN